MRKIGELVGVVVFGALIALAAVRSAPAPSAAPESVTVDVIGDSLVTQAADELVARLAAAHLDATVAHRPRQDLGSAFVQEQLGTVRARPRADVLVLATAANDALRDRDRTLASGADAAAAAYRELLDRSVAPFTDRCIVMVNAREDTDDIYHPEFARALNAHLRDARGRHPNLVLVDWATLSREVPRPWFAPDQLHFGEDPAVPSMDSGSARAYASAIIDGITHCPSS